ncbi:MAG: hypothetical protein WC799_25520 [Desulfobacteraceae bacterium]
MLHKSVQIERHAILDGAKIWNLRLNPLLKHWHGFQVGFVFRAG